ncbi:maltodextrin glucosidase [Lachnospiraceae bacterium KM106-2]|nr:maltodextrin glucosidase [Lachnospiraceae bacterium KM106-2]
MKKEKIIIAILSILLICSTLKPANASTNVKSKGVAMNVTKATINTDDVVALDAITKPINSTDTITWTSKNKNIATVNKYGVVTGIGLGKTTITAKTSSGKTAICKVNVVERISSEDVEEMIDITPCTPLEGLALGTKFRCMPASSFNTKLSNGDSAKITSFKATLSEINKFNANSSKEYYPFGVKVSISGSVDAKYAGKNISIYIKKVGESNSFYYLTKVKSDGSFSTSYTQNWCDVPLLYFTKIKVGSL